jgi:FkbM family methyltransferase
MLIDKIIKYYSIIFSNKYLSKINNLLLSISLKAKGYGLGIAMEDNGEEYFIKNVLKTHRPEICFDIGANIGEYSLFLNKYTNAKIYAFEPLPESFKKLKKMTLGKNVICENIALGSKTEIRTLYYNPKSSQKASLHRDMNKIHYVKNNYKKMIRALTLDEFVKKNKIKKIDLIKIDTEGHELEVIKGSLKTISNLKPTFIQIEMNWHSIFANYNLYDLSIVLKEYDVFQLLPNKLVKINPQHPHSNFPIYSNFIFKKINT